MIIDKAIDDFQPYFHAYCIAKHISFGDEVQFWQYAPWITGKHKEFKSLNGYRDDQMPLLEKHMEQFKEWLFEQAKQEADHVD